MESIKKVFTTKRVAVFLIELIIISVMINEMGFWKATALFVIGSYCVKVIKEAIEEQLNLDRD